MAAPLIPIIVVGGIAATGWALKQLDGATEELTKLVVVGTIAGVAAPIIVKKVLKVR